MVRGSPNKTVLTTKTMGPKKTIPFVLLLITTILFTDHSSTENINTFPPKKVEKKIYEMTIDEIDALIRQVDKSKMTNAEKIAFYSELFLGCPYSLKESLGDGPYAKYDTAPLVNFKKVNCMTFCEEVLALSLSATYEEMFNVLQHIRYRNGIISMSTRNHYTMADWLPENKWCLRDVTYNIGRRKYCRRMTKIISHKKFFTEKGYTDIEPIKPDRKLSIWYIPKEYLLSVSSKLKSGDIAALIQDKEGIFAAHMGIIIKKDQEMYFRHSTISEGTTLDEKFGDYVNKLLLREHIVGMSFMRVREKPSFFGPERIHRGKIKF